MMGTWVIIGMGMNNGINIGPKGFVRMRGIRCTDENTTILAGCPVFSKDGVIDLSLIHI